MDVFNPSTGQLRTRLSWESAATVQAKAQKAQQAFLAWRMLSFAKRGEYLSCFSSLLQENKDNLASLITEEMGMPIIAARSEIEKCAITIDFYVKNAQSLLQPRTVLTAYSQSTVYCEPLGVIFGIMPWNFPFWQVIRFAIPTLMAGNVVMLKHAPITTGCGLAIAQLMQQAQVPAGVYTPLVIDDKTADNFIAHPVVRGVSFTGSTATGRQVATAAAQALKPVVLELGGNDPYIILADANLAQAAAVCAKARLLNNGQCCIAAKRIIVDKTVMAAFQEYLHAAIKCYQRGNPLDVNTQLGPLARADLRNHVHQQVQDSIKKGAKLQQGGELLEGQGYYYPITLLTDVQPGMPVFDEECFGPVFALIEANNEEHAIDLANNSCFGLGAAIFTSDTKKGEHLARYAIVAGSCFVNEMVATQAALPVGGIKNSGMGRELEEGIKAFMNIKTVCVA